MACPPLAHTSSLTCFCATNAADAASKHATQAFFDCLRAEVEQCGIEVTVISPSYIHTSLSLNAVTADGSRYGGEAPLSLLFWGKLLTTVRHTALT